MVIALTLALAGVLALAALAGAAVLVLAVALVQGMVIAGWHRTLGVPGAVGGMVLAGVAAAAADLLLWLRDDPRPLSPAAGVLGLTIAGGFFHQLTRRWPREQLTASLTGTVTLATVAVLAAVFVSARQTHGGAALVSAVALSAGVARLPDLVPMSTWVRATCGLLLGAAVGLLVGGWTIVGPGPGLLLGLAGAAAAELGAALVRRAPAADLYTAAGLPLALAAPVAYVLGRILVG